MDLRFVTSDDRQLCDSNDGNAAKYAITQNWTTQVFCTECLWKFLHERIDARRTSWMTPARQHTYYLEFLTHGDEPQESVTARRDAALKILGIDPADYAEMDGSQQEYFEQSLLRPDMHDAVLQAITMSSGNVIAIWHDVDGSMQYELDGCVAAYAPVYYWRDGGVSADSVSFGFLETDAIAIPLEIALIVGHDQLFHRMRSDFDTDVRFNQQEGNPHFCAYCGSKAVQSIEPPASHDTFGNPLPDTDIEAAWDSRYEEHYPGCEWIVTRAHTVANESGAH